LSARLAAARAIFLPVESFSSRLASAGLSDGQNAAVSQILKLATGSPTIWLAIHRRLFGWRFKWRQMLRIRATQADVEAALLERDSAFRQSYRITSARRN
jgi:hypothetical protein